MNRRRLWVTFAIACCLSTRLAYAQGFAPEEAAKRMTTAPGVRVSLFAAEPEVRQPIMVQCDDRGRLWTIQYLQYPNPAGLKRVEVDRWSRTVYDRVPEPPPHGPRGDDRITIIEDTDGDGRADRFHDFVDGLNLATGLAFGDGGVYVLNVPYLLFYPDRDRDDVPDGDPRVVLSGFGMEDAQSFANHLTWGPDGWLYGVNGSTTTCKIRGIEFQQGVWRYHPASDRFELFCEGGSNTYGLTFDARGELYYSTNGGPFVHALQGGYFYKSFGKHGPLHNPYAYHYFEPLEVDQVPGGPPTGGTLYLASALPEALRGTFIAGNFLGHTVSWWTIEPVGATVRARYGGVLVDAHDTWCGPTDLCLASDGGLFFCDFYDRRTAHPDPDANWDRTNGRIYKIELAEREVGESALRRPFDLAKLTSSELVELLESDNRWFVDRARVELGTRRDASIVPRLREMVFDQSHPQRALDALWALYVSGGLDEATAVQLLGQTDETIRGWTVRLLADPCQVSSRVQQELERLAAVEERAAVRLQLAIAARRLAGEQGLPIVERLLARGIDQQDERLRWSLWWAIESKATSDRERLLDMFADASAWESAARRFYVPLLVRRYAAAGNAEGYDACARLIAATPAAFEREVLEHLNLGLAERSRRLPGVEQGGLFETQAALTGGNAGSAEPASAKHEPVSAALRELIERRWSSERDDALALELALRSEVDGAPTELLQRLSTSGLASGDAPSLLGLAKEFGTSEIVPPILGLVTATQPEDVQLLALDVLARFDADDVASALVERYASMSPAVRQRARGVLWSRPKSAAAFLALVDEGRIAPAEVPIDELRRISLHDDAALDATVRRHWGNIGPGTPEEKLAIMRRLSNDLRAEAGDSARGKPLYVKHCGTCHTLAGEGNKIGPDLTTANRHDRAALLANIVDPSAVVRSEYLNHVVQTAGGRVLTGLVAEQDAGSITVLDAENRRTKLPRDEIDTIEPSSVSLMPEKILDQLSPQDLRDLFRYLEQ